MPKFPKIQTFGTGTFFHYSLFTSHGLWWASNLISLLNYYLQNALVSPLLLSASVGTLPRQKKLNEKLLNKKEKYIIYSLVTLAQAVTPHKAHTH